MCTGLRPEDSNPCRGIPALPAQGSRTLPVGRRDPPPLDGAVCARGEVSSAGGDRAASSSDRMPQGGDTDAALVRLPRGTFPLTKPSLSRRRLDRHGQHRYTYAMNGVRLQRCRTRTPTTCSSSPTRSLEPARKRRSHRCTLRVRWTTQMPRRGGCCRSNTYTFFRSTIWCASRTLPPAAKMDLPAFLASCVRDDAEPQTAK